MNKLLTLFLILSFQVFSILSQTQDYIIAVVDSTGDGVETKETGVSQNVAFFLSEDLENDRKGSFPFKSLDLFIDGDNLDSPINLGTFVPEFISHNKITNQYSIYFEIPPTIASGIYFYSIKGVAFNGRSVVGSSQNFNVGEVVDSSTFKILSPTANAIWMTKSVNHTIVFTIPKTAGQANKFLIKLIRVDEAENTYYPVLDSSNANEPTIALLDKDGVLCHVKNAKYLIWSPIPNVPTGRYQLELYGYQDSVQMTNENAFGAAYNGKSEIFSLVRGDEWGGVVKNRGQHLYSFSCLPLLSIVLIFAIYFRYNN